MSRNPVAFLVRAPGPRWSVILIAMTAGFATMALVAGGYVVQPRESVAPEAVSPAALPALSTPAKELADRTVYATAPDGARLAVHFAADGRLSGLARHWSGAVRADRGIWEAGPEGQICRRWNVWDRGRRRCAEGADPEAALRALFTAPGARLHIAPGDPENLTPASTGQPTSGGRRSVGH